MFNNKLTMDSAGFTITISYMWTILIKWECL